MAPKCMENHANIAHMNAESGTWKLEARNWRPDPEIGHPNLETWERKLGKLCKKLETGETGETRIARVRMPPAAAGQAQQGRCSNISAPGLLAPEACWALAVGLLHSPFSL